MEKCILILWKLQYERWKWLQGELWTKVASVLIFWRILIAILHRRLTCVVHIQKSTLGIHLRKVLMILRFSWVFAHNQGFTVFQGSITHGWNNSLLSWWSVCYVQQPLIVSLNMHWGHVTNNTNGAHWTFMKAYGTTLFRWSWGGCMWILSHLNERKLSKRLNILETK